MGYKNWGIYILNLVFAITLVTGGSKNKYDQAISYLENILIIDSKNKEAQNLKDNYQKAIQLAKEKAEETKKISGNVKPKTSSTKQRPVTQSISSTSYKGGVRIIDNGKGLNIGVRGLIAIFQPRSIVFILKKSGTNESVTYKATFHLEGKNITKTGIAKGDFQYLLLDSDVELSDREYNVDFEVTYKGKVFKFSDSFSGPR